MTGAPEPPGHSAVELDRAKLAEDHIGLADALANRASSGGGDTEELTGVARLGLVAAAHRFNPDTGVPFGGYASQVIWGELRRWLRDRTGIVRVPRALTDLARAARETDARLTSELGRPATLAEIAAQNNVEPDAVAEALEADAGRRRREEVDGQTAGGDHYAAAEDRIAADQMLAVLTDGEAELIRWRFFDDLEQKDIADRLGVNQSTVSRMVNRALAKMREAADTPE